MEFDRQWNCAVVTGIAGQVGSYLGTELLASRVVQVVGVSRECACARGSIPASIAQAVELEQWDGKDPHEITDIVSRYRPSMLFNLTALSSGAAMFDDPLEIAEINGLAVACIVETIRKVIPGIRLYQASSSEMFGEPTQSSQSEATCFNPRNPYGAEKVYAH